MASSEGAIPGIPTTHDFLFCAWWSGRSEFDSRPACHFLLLTVFKKNGRVVIEFRNDT